MYDCSKRLLCPLSNIVTITNNFLVDDGQQQALGINFHMFNNKENNFS
jgi:hypothetical protein